MRLARIATPDGPRPVVERDGRWLGVVDLFDSPLEPTGESYPLEGAELLAPVEPLVVLGMAHKEWRSEVTPHTLRRTFATILLNSGNPLDAVADVLGHESVDTTRRHYAFASDERRRQTIHSFEV